MKQGRDEILSISMSIMDGRELHKQFIRVKITPELVVKNGG